jgi:sialidase-1
MRMNIIFLGALIAGISYSCFHRSDSSEDPGGNHDSGIAISQQPIFAGRNENELVTITIPVADYTNNPVSLKRLDLNFDRSSRMNNLSSLKIYYSGISEPSDKILFGSSDSPSINNAIKGEVPLRDSVNILTISFDPAEMVDLTARLIIENITFKLSDKREVNLEIPSGKNILRFGQILRAAGQDNCDTYRIPGIIKTNSGTLIAVYDNRYKRSKDLQEDIDIGMSRSTDGGNSWETMKVIMDMGEYGGRPEELNGTGDPCILYDHNTNTVWVAALWMSGASPDVMVWNASQPGMTPEETGQFLLVKSTDDGITWSEPINITKQIKDPSWQLLLQGPGRGITTTDGTLVFPAQFKTDIGEPALYGGQYTCHSTLVWSNDGGTIWNIGTGAMSNTTEAQVVELTNGTLMLNMRDDLNRKEKGVTNGRAIAVTKDLGKTWVVHPTSNSALPEPNCMASLITADLIIDGVKTRVLFFSNPDNKNSRSNMTIKASIDEGSTWPEKYQLEVYEPEGYGYSCMTMVDEKTLGILYEGSKELYFQKIAVSDILGSAEE